MNFSGFSDRSLVGKLVRLPLKALPGHMAVPILQGRLRGKRWIVGSSVHGCWLGSYEYDKRQLFETVVRNGAIVFDVGAHVGFYTLLASILVGPKGRVFAFEPLPANLSYLKKHLSLNHVSNAEIVQVAVSDHCGKALFQKGESTSTGHIDEKGNLLVDTVSLDALMAQSKIPIPNYLKIDVEGAEMLVLNGAKKILMDAHPTIFLATHGRDMHDQCCEFLGQAGYRLRPIGRDSLDECDEILAYGEG